MTDRPIIFSAPMVRALLDGRKTMTRRLAWHVSMNPGGAINDGGGQMDYVEPHEERHPSPWQRVQAGDRLWVRENVQAIERYDGTDGVGYPADDAWMPIKNAPEASERWVELFYYRGRGKGRIGNPVPSIHMPRWASRLTLTVTAVRVERLQEISAGNAIREGIAYPPTGMTLDEACEYGVDPRGEFRTLWNSLHGPEAWAANPEVVALTFTVERRNIDAR